MPKKNKNLTPILANDLEGFKREFSKLPRLIANEAVNEFKGNFQRQGFRDQTTKPWKPRKKADPGRGILIGKGGGKKLMKSIRKKVATKKRILVGTSETTKDYAGVHNYGLRSGRGKGFKMPKRQFVGHSKMLSSNIRILILKRINKGFDK
jgi:phage virion morphogenesis protein